MEESKPFRKQSHNEVAGLTEALHTSEIGHSTNSSNIIQSLSLEAIFHPKFENENREHSVRHEMIQKVHGNKGYLEVSLKHSGNLLLWSGGQRYYSKNATSNAFTFVGEMLLRQHFCRAWFSDKSRDGASMMYQECSDYVEENRLTLSFEAVTAVLGQHGDVPKRDFLILTAIADKSAIRFYNTAEVLEMAQRFRLPHNDVWVFSEPDAVDQLFRLYDTTRETGFASGTIASLNESANAHVASMYPHVDFQGNILEGIVIRYVSFKQDEQAQQQQQLRSLAERATYILARVPADTPPSFELTKGAGSKVLAVDVRSVHAQCIAEEGYTNLIPRLGDQILNTLETAEPLKRKLERQPKGTWDLVFIAKQLLLSSDLDTETKLIASLIDKLDNDNATVNYSLYKRNDGRLVCTIHILHDNAFINFQKKMKPGDMHLYRGFSIELCTTKHEAKMDASDNRESSATKTDDTSDASLMLKMKFLPYMVRTFCCRNGLQIIKTQGPAAFSSFTRKLMNKWGISEEGQAKWWPLFWAWGQYVHDCTTNSARDYINKSLPPMDAAFYLNHLDHFLPIFETGGFHEANAAAINGPEASSYRAMVVVVAPEKERAQKVADFISQNLGGLRFLEDLNDLKETHLMEMPAPRSGGLIVTATIDQGIGKLRKFVKEYGESISILLVDCDDETIDASLLPNTRKLKGLVKGWQKTRVALVQQVDSLSVFGCDTTMSPFSPILPNEKIEHLLLTLRNVSNKKLSPGDRSRGLLIFFPCLPGCGKSTLSGEATLKLLQDALEDDSKELESDYTVRRIHTMIGDKIKNKYWMSVKKVRCKDPACIIIADKNAPTSAWPTVGTAAGNGLVVPAVQKGALCTTTIQGIIHPDGEYDPNLCHHYPFSLHYLAVCMARVMSRPALSHEGGLDSYLPQACLVMLKFYCLYRNISSDDFMAVMSAKIGRSGAICIDGCIEIPFFASTDLPDLPLDLVQVLTEAIQLYYGYERQSKVAAETLVEKDRSIQGIEARLRKAIENHKNFLFSLATQENVSRTAFIGQIVSYVREIDSVDCNGDHMLTPEAKPMPDNIRLVAIDVPVLSISQALFSVAKKDISVLQALEAMGADVDASHFGTGFVEQTHVTMAFCDRCSQEEMRSTFEGVIGQSVVLESTGLFYNNRIAAMAVNVPQSTKIGDPLPRCKNSFAHITLWKNGSRSVDSNMLPQKVNEGEAFHDVFDKPIQLEGTLSFWFTKQYTL